MNRMLVIAAVAALAACGGGEECKQGDVADSDNATFGTATPLALGTTVKDRVTGFGDYDFFVVTVADGTMRIVTQPNGGSACSYETDTIVEVFDGAQNFLELSDDSGSGFSEDFRVAVTAGTYYVRVNGWDPFPFNYTLRVTQP